MSRQPEPRRYLGVELALIVLIAVQGFCAAFFLVDLARDFIESPATAMGDLHFWVEMIANVGLVAGIGVEWAFLMRLLRRQARAERALSAASGALHDVIEAHFEDWGLTPAEADVATFAIKGLSIAEIARMRGSAEGTVKTQLNAVYRKAGVRGRTELVTILIEDLLDGALSRRRKDERAGAESCEDAGVVVN